MLKRIVYGTIAILAILAIFSLDALVARWAIGGGEPPGAGPIVLGNRLSHLLQHGSVVPVGFSLIMVLAAVELLKLQELRGAFVNKPFTLVMVVAVFLSPWLSAGGLLGEDVAAVEGLYWPLVLLAFTLIGGGGLHVLRGRAENSIADLGAMMLTVAYIGFLGSFALQLRSGADSPSEAGVWLLLITLLVTKASDIGAYFTGSAIGRHRLSPNISPKKSVEGALGGIVGSALVAVGLVLAANAITTGLDGDGTRPIPFIILSDMTAPFASYKSGSPVPIIRAAIFGVLVSIAGQLGDLFESCFKRDAGIKDSGSVLPQFGGILDLIDSPVFAVPVAWFLLTRVWHLV